MNDVTFLNAEITLVEIVMDKLYSEDKLTGDEMRNLAQMLSSTLNGIRIASDIADDA